MKTTPPRYILNFLRWFCREDFLDEVEGDLTELFSKQYRHSPATARWKFAVSVVRYLRPEYMKAFQSRSSPYTILSIPMIQNYIKLAFRNLRKRTAFSIINITGLALGVCSCLIILNYIDFETSYDNFHTHASDLYRINRTLIQNGEAKMPHVMTTYGLGPALETDFPEVKHYIRTHEEAAVLQYQPDTQEAKAFHENRILIADSTFFQAFTFKSRAGNLERALNDPNSIVLTQSTARKYFGSESPVGKTMVLSGGRMNGDYTVTSVIEDVPGNSHFVFDILVPMHNIFLTKQYQQDDGWGWNNFTTYIQLRERASADRVRERLPDFCQRRLDPKWKDINGRIVLALQPLQSIHLQPGLRMNVETVNPNTIYFFGVIGVFILFIAWINYINLSTARAMERAHEVGIKKAIGALRGELIVQFLCESVVINFIGIVLALCFAVALLPSLSDIIGRRLAFNFSDLRLWLVLAALFLIGTLASGIYPAFVLSSFKITRVIKGQSDARGFSLRKALVVFQFAASLILIAGTLVVYRQIHFMQAQDKGLQMDQMLVVSGPGTIRWKEAKQRLAVLKEEALKINGVKEVATSGAIPGGGHNWGADVRKSGAAVTENKPGSVVWIDPDFIPAYNIQFVAGKNFNPNITSDMEAVIINEASLDAYDLGTAEQALHQQLVMGEDTATIVGVLKNYNWSSLKTDYVPFLFRADTILPPKISIHVQAQNIPATVEAIGKLYKELIPGEPFEYTFLDDSFNAQYKSDLQFGNIFAMFASLAVAISCLGLWGLASFTTARRLKEIGVRKVLGASVSSIVILLSGQFMRLVVIAAAIALPAVWYGSDTWLHNFAFRIALGLDLFILPVAMLALIALLTVSLQVFKAAITNPAKVLRRV